MSFLIQDFLAQQILAQVWVQLCDVSPRTVLLNVSMELAFSPNWQVLTGFFAAVAIATSLMAIAFGRRLWHIAEDETLCIAILNLLPDLVIRMKQDGTVVGVRAGHQFPLSQPPQSLVGQTIDNIVSPPIAKQLIDLMQQAIATDTIQTCEVLVESEGKSRWREIRMVARKSNEVLMIVRDTTPYRDMMDELRQQKEQSQAILTAIPDLMFQLAADGTYLGYVRPNQLTDLLPVDYDPVGKHVTEYLPPDHAQRNLDSLRRVLETGEVLVYEQEVTINGSLQHEEVRVVASGDDRALFMVRDISPYRRSEAERDRTAKQLQQQLNRVLLLEQITHEIRSHLDRQHIFTAASIQIGRAFGTNRCLIYTYRGEALPAIRLVAEYGEMGYEPLQSLEIPVLGNAHVEAILASDRAIASDDVLADPLLDTLQDIYVELQLKSMLAIRTSYQDQPNGVIGLHQCDRHRSWSHDEITLLEAVAAQVGIALYHARLLEQEQLQREELQQKSHELEQVTRDAQAANRAKSIFLANMSHELRTPLNAILGFAQVMQLDASLLKETQEFIQIILQSGEHLLNLINTVLDLSKVESGKLSFHPQEFSLSSLMTQIQVMFQQQVEKKGLQLTTLFAENLTDRISTDEGKLLQVVMNLVGNAIKFTDRGSVKIRVSVAPYRRECLTNPVPEYPLSAEAIATADPASDESSESSLKILSSEHSECIPLPMHPLFDSGENSVAYLCIEVEDTGQGIEAHEIDTIFEAFVQTEAGQMAPDGTGLGLTISKRFVELLGGTIWVRSQPNQGSTFGLEIPVISEPQSSGRETVAPQNVERSFPVAALQAMPTLWHQQLYNAAIRCDGNAVQDLLAQIPPQEAPLIEALDPLLHSFRFDQIARILESVEPQSVVFD